MSRPLIRKEITILDISMVDESKSIHSKPVMKTESESKPTLAADIQELLLPEELKTRMFAHQIDGLQWLYGL